MGVRRSLLSDLRSSSNEYVCDQSRPCTSNEQYLDTNDTLVISGMSNDVCDSALVEKTNIGTEEEKQLLMRQLQISTGKSICPILRKFAMTLHFYSPSAYSYVRTIFSKALPDVSTIRKWYSKLDGLPVMDEMSIKQRVHWTGTRHQGYIDFGLGGKTEEMDNLPYAKDAFVIMVVGINTSWKVLIAYYLINGISAEEKANIILNCLQELDTTGVIIKTLTFDGAANNLSMVSELEANLQYSDQDHIEMLFSAIRAKGGFNNNPTVSQFEAAYKSIIVHSEIKSSSSANCMALDDTTILTVSSSNIKVKDTQSELLDLLCVAGTDDLENDNLLSVYQHSNFINDVVASIAGFVV
ncbi:hypothetical protein QTP88_011192 [Uroleucon formosanum]